MESEDGRLRRLCIVVLFVLSALTEAQLTAARSQRRLSAEDWGSLLVTPWSKTHVRDSLLSRTGNVQQSIPEAEISSANWLYLVGVHPDAVEAIAELAGSGAHHLSAASGESVHWFIAYMSRETAERLRTERHVKLVQALPQALKVEPHHLGQKLQALRLSPEKEADEKLKQPEDLKIVLANGAFSHKEEAQKKAESWEQVLNGRDVPCEEGSEPSCQDASPISCSAADTDAIVCGPVSASQLQNATEWLAAQPEALVVELRRPFRIFNKWAKQVVQSESAAAVPIFSGGLLGQGEIIGLADTGIEMNHCFFYDENRPPPFNKIDPLHRKVVSYITFDDNTDTADGHGTHVAGTLAGNTFVGLHPYAGMAPGAKIAFFDMGYGGSDSLAAPVSLRQNLFPYAYKAGARVHSNSWGADLEGYGSDARDVDDFSYKNEDFLAVFAAGNDGDNGTFTIASPGNAKNCVTVGASLNSLAAFQQQNPGLKFGIEVDPGTIAPFSSVGPTVDGRIKPDLVAPGMPIFSAMGQPGVTPASDCQIDAQQGTSEATPIVAGLAALVRQYFREGYYPTGSPNAASSLYPCGALVKATLIHSCVPMTQYMDPDNNLRQLGNPPDPIQGFGRPVLETMLAFATNVSTAGPISTFVRNGRSDGSLLTSGQAHKYSVVVRSSQQALRATMVWTDPAASPNSLFPMINDLDLTIVDANGTITHSNGRSSADTSNNVEQITVATVKPGTYSVVVAGASVVLGPQPYALVITGDLATIGPPSVGTVPARSRANVQLDSGALRTLSLKESSWLTLIVAALWLLMHIDGNH